MLNILSLGAGVQSTTMALMAEHGEIKPMPDCAIFADTGAEPQHVYDQLEKIRSQVSYPVHTVMKDEGLERAIIDGLKGGKEKRFAGAPFFVESDKGGGMLRRQCTNEYKIQPIQQKVRKLLGLKRRQHGPKEVWVSMWIGISMDEMIRMKPNPVNYILNRWPLVEIQMYRYDCVKWMREHGYDEPQKSACYFCPYSDNSTWQNMMDHDPKSFDKAVKMDKLIREGTASTTGKLYLHRSMKPLEDCEFDPDRDQFDMFDNECEGMCGL